MSDYLTVRETHSAVVLLVGDRAYKLKKPVDLGFLDFGTRAKREAACRDEVALNRRLSPDVYLGVADIRGPDGAPCDHLVVMRRMPSERRLTTLVRAGAPVHDQVRAVARLVAAFHATARRGPEIAAEGGRDAILGRWTESFHQVRPFRGGAIEADLLDEIERRTVDFLAGREPLFADRIADGRVVDGHGDLLADDIFCLDDGPRVLDCIEFAERLRWLDGLDDAAFLAMDLERLGAPELAGRFLDWYAEFSADPAPPSLRHHYVAYRAFVRAKVACLRSAQGDEEAAADAAAHAALTVEHLRAGAVRLILVGGLPGTGKSTASPTGSVPCCSPATGCARSSRASRPSPPPPRPTSGASTRRSGPIEPTPSWWPGRARCSGAASPWCWTRPGSGRATGTWPATSRPVRTAPWCRCAAWRRRRPPAAGCATAATPSPTPTSGLPPRWRPGSSRGPRR
jgi:hypothetical protein